jgi:hypothetical protein
MCWFFKLSDVDFCQCLDRSWTEVSSPFFLPQYNQRELIGSWTEVLSPPFNIKKINFNKKRKKKQNKMCTFAFEIDFFNIKRMRGDC